MVSEGGWVRGTRREGGAPAAEVRRDLHQRALNDGLRLADIRDMGFETAYTSVLRA